MALGWFAIRAKVSARTDCRKRRAKYSRESVDPRGGGRRRRVRRDACDSMLSNI